MNKSFFIDENVAKAVELYKNPAAIKELEELSMNAANDGVSVIAVEKSTGKVVGVSFNKLQVCLAYIDFKLILNKYKNLKYS